MDLALHIELVALNLKNGVVCLSQAQSLLCHVLFDLLESDLWVSHIVSLAEL